jgi:hypothetical protein
VIERQEAHDAKANAGFTPIRRQLDSIVPKEHGDPCTFRRGLRSVSGHSNLFYCQSIYYVSEVVSSL